MLSLKQQQPLHPNQEGPTWGLCVGLTKEQGCVSQRIFQAAPPMPLVEYQGLFPNTLSSSRFRSTAFKWKVWDFAIDLK